MFGHSGIHVDHAERMFMNFNEMNDFRPHGNVCGNLFALSRIYWGNDGESGILWRKGKKMFSRKSQSSENLTCEIDYNGS